MTAPRAMVGVALQGLGFALVWGVRGPGPIAAWRAPVAALLAIGSIALAGTAIRHLGRHWSIRARTVQDHRLITTGPYRVVRHPIYVATAGLLIAPGLAFAPSWAIAVACGAYIAGTLIRVHAEDALMAATFGPAFEEYRSRVPALIPRI